MLKCVIYWIFVALLLTAVHSQAQDSPSDDTSSTNSSVTAPSSTPKPSSSDSTTASVASSTSSPGSSSESTSVSTASTGSSSSSTGSSSSSTGSSPTESTTVPTVSPTTGSSTVVPVTTPVPEPPKPEKGNWTVSDNDTTCIRAEMAALFTIPLKDNRTFYIALSPNASDAQSECQPPNLNNTQILILTDITYAFTMEFEKDDKQIYVKEMTFSYNIEGTQGLVHTNSSKYFPVKNGNSYMCNANKNIAIENVTLAISSLRLQAFGKKGNTGYTAAEECDADDDVNQIVPIAVGCALAALVIIVLIAYLVGRRRSRQKGYQSV